MAETTTLIERKNEFGLNTKERMNNCRECGNLKENENHPRRAPTLFYGEKEEDSKSEDGEISEISVEV